MQSPRTDVHARNQDDHVWEAVLDYLSLGWHVLPISSADNRLTGSSLLLSAKLTVSLRFLFFRLSSELSANRRMFRGCNIGIATGVKSGVVVLDIDGPAGMKSLANLKLPETRSVQTGNGLHLYFRHPGKGFFVPNVPGILAEGIDIKGEGGTVVAPPSLHASGRSYQWVDAKVEVADLPATLLETISGLPHRRWWKRVRNFVYHKYFRFPFNRLTGL